MTTRTVVEDVVVGDTMIAHVTMTVVIAIMTGAHGTTTEEEEDMVVSHVITTAVMTIDGTEQ